MISKRQKNILFWVLFLLVSLFLFWKCRYGIGNVDESFYLTVPYRLCRGDALFLEEWHLSQMAGVLTAPFVAAFLAITGSTEGIILTMRYICTFLWCLSGGFVYYRLRKLSWVGAVAASLSFMLYIPFSIPALSYNSMGILLQVLSLVILLTAQKQKAFQYTLSGLLYAGAVLCCPYLAGVYFLYAGGAILWALLKKQRGVLHGWLFFTLGAALAAAAFASFLLSRASLGDMGKAFVQILNDPEHPPISLYLRLRLFFQATVFSGKLSSYAYWGLGLTLAAALLDKKRRQHRLIYFLFSCGFVLALMYINTQKSYINCLMWSVNLLAPITAVLSRRNIYHKLLLLGWLPGMLYSFCLHMASNQLFLAISSASAVATVTSLLMICLFAGELAQDRSAGLGRYAAVLALAVILVFQIGSQGYFRYETVFWEDGIQDQTELLSQGINKGLYVSPSAKKIYTLGFDYIKVMEPYAGKQVLFLSDKTWYYLTGDYDIAAYSAWLSGVNEHTLQRLLAYYELNPGKLPEAVFAADVYEDIANRFCDALGYQLTAVEGGFLLTK